MQQSGKISINLWFDSEAESAALFYTRIFKNSSIQQITHYCGIGEEHHGRPTGSVMTVAFELNGQPFIGLNGGPMFKFNEAISLVVRCADQQELDYYWEHLSQGGDPEAQRCGWLKDQYGVSWQIVPANLSEYLNTSDKERGKRVLQALLAMQKIDIAALQKVA